MEHFMDRKKSILIALMSLGLAFGAASTASAATWRHNHPRRAEVNARLVHQDRRINRERREGEITRTQARYLHTEDRGIRANERFDASRDGSHITRAEDRNLNHQENAVSQQIGH
jgi:hypothetical protein